MMKRLICLLLVAVLVGPVSRVSAQDETKPAARMLFLTQSAGFQHGSVTRKEGVLSPAERAMTSLGVGSKLFRVDCTQDAAQDFTREKLKNYDLVMFYTTGDLPIAEEDLDYFFNDWLKQEGHGFIGVHSAADTYHNYEPYWDMIGGTFDGHPWGAGSPPVAITVHDPDHPICKPWGGDFRIQDEIYQFKHWQPEKVRVLMSLDMANTALKKPYHVPIAWCKEYGDGRMFHMSLGHREDVWTNEDYIASLEGGIRWILHLEEGSAEPNPELDARENEKAAAAVAAAGGEEEAS